MWEDGGDEWVVGGLIKQRVLKKPQGNPPSCGPNKSLKRKKYHIISFTISFNCSSFNTGGCWTLVDVHVETAALTRTLLSQSSSITLLLSPALRP